MTWSKLNVPNLFRDQCLCSSTVTPDLWMWSTAICQTLPLIYGHTQLLVKHSWLLINTESPLAYLWSPWRIPPAIHHCRATQVATMQFFSERFTFIRLLFSFAFVCLHNRFQRKRLQNCFFPFVSVFLPSCVYLTNSQSVSTSASNNQ